MNSYELIYRSIACLQRNRNSVCRPFPEKEPLKIGNFDGKCEKETRNFTKILLKFNENFKKSWQVASGYAIINKNAVKL